MRIFKNFLLGIGLIATALVTANATISPRPIAYAWGHTVYDSFDQDDYWVKDGQIYAYATRYGPGGYVTSDFHEAPWLHQGMQVNIYADTSAATPVYTTGIIIFRANASAPWHTMDDSGTEVDISAYMGSLPAFSMEWADDWNGVGTGMEVAVVPILTPLADTETWGWQTYYKNYSAWSTWSPDVSSVTAGQTFTQSRTRTYEEWHKEVSSLGNERNDSFVQTITETENQSATGTMANTNNFSATIYQTVGDTVEPWADAYAHTGSHTSGREQEWMSNPPGSSATISQTAPTWGLFTFDVEGTYIYTLVIGYEDNWGNPTSSDTITITYIVATAAATETWSWQTYYKNYSGWSAWTPDPSTIPTGQSFQQSRTQTYEEWHKEVSNLGNERNDSFVQTITDTQYQDVLGTMPPTLQDQTITFPAIADKLNTDAPFTADATASSGLPVSYSISGPATMSGSTITLTGAGTVSITASQAGNGSYNAAPNVTVSFNVTIETFTWTTYYKNYSPWSAWSPDPSTVPSGQSFSQTRSRTYEEWTKQVSDQTGITKQDNFVQNHTETENQTVTGTLTYTLTINIVGSGSTTGQGAYNPAAAATLSATPANANWVFIGWSGPDATSISGNSITMSKNMVVTATFVDISTAVDRGIIDFGTAYLPAAIATPKQTWRDINITNDGGAPLNLFSVAITTGTDFTVPVTTGTIAAGASTSAAVKFSPLGVSTLDRSDTLYVISNDSVPIVKYTLVGHPMAQVAQTITFPNPGTLWADDLTYTLNATASSGLPVSFSVVSGPATVTGNILSFTGVAGTLTVRASQPGNGSWFPATDVDQTFQVNKAPVFTSAASATATINTAFNFAVNAVGTPAAVTYSSVGLPSWLTLNSATGALTGTPTLASQLGNFTFTLTAANGRTTSQTFNLTVNNRNYHIDLVAAPVPGGIAQITVPGPAASSGDYPWNSSPTIKATPNTGYRFDTWTGGLLGGNVSLPTTTHHLLADITLTANFVKTWVVRAYSNPTTGGTVNLNGTGTSTDVTISRDNGAAVNVVAAANIGWRFTGWSGDSVSTNLNISNAATADATYVANFIRQWVLTVNTTTGGTVTGGGTFDNGVNAPITASANPGYRFTGWTGATGIADSAALVTTVRMDATKTVTANFVKTWVLTVTQTGTGNGTVIGAGTYDDNTYAPISAVPDAFSTFDGWSGAGAQFGVNGDEAGYADSHILMNGDKTANAQFINTATLVYGGILHFGNVYWADNAPVDPRAQAIAGVFNNTGNFPLTFTGASIPTGPTDFGVTTVPLPTTVAINGSTNVEVRFNPSMAGNRTGRVVFSTNDPVLAGVYYDLVGNGVDYNVAPAITVNRTSGVPGTVDDQHYTYAGDTIALRLRGTDPNRNLNRIEYYVVTPAGTIPLTTLSQNPSTYGTAGNDMDVIQTLALNAGPGSYEVYARAVDADGLQDPDGFTRFQFSITVSEKTTTLTITAQNTPNEAMKTWIRPSAQISQTFSVLRITGPY